MNIKDILLELENRYGSSLFKLDDQEVCNLMVNGKIMIHLKGVEEEGAFLLYSRVGSIPREAEQTSKLNQYLLENNLYGSKAEGASFALDKETNGVILFKRLDEEGLEFQFFINKLEQFISYTSHWQEKLKKEVSGKDSSGSKDSKDKDPPFDPLVSGYIKI